MATQINLPVAVAVLALAIIGYSFFSSNSFSANAIADANAVYGTPPSAFCNDDDDINIKFQGNCTDGRGTFVEVCQPNGKVREYYCAPNNLCQNRAIGCGYKEACVEGACVAY